MSIIDLIISFFAWVAGKSASDADSEDYSSFYHS